MHSDERFEITAIACDGKPIEPIRTKEAFAYKCGVLVRYKIPISIHQWLKPKNEDPEVSYVSDMQKEDLWTTLKTNFTIPPEEDPKKPVKEELIKSHALKKMAELFRRWKSELKTTFVDKEITAEFTGQYEKIRDHWLAFVAHKTSDKSKKMSTTNKKNAVKKKQHHRTGSGGYLKSESLWAKVENDLIDKGVKPETLNLPDSCRTWFFGVGGTLDPISGKCVWTDEQLRIPSRGFMSISIKRIKGRSFQTERRTSSQWPSRILSTLDRHEARQAPFRGKLGFQTQGVPMPGEEEESGA